MQKQTQNPDQDSRQNKNQEQPLFKKSPLLTMPKLVLIASFIVVFCAVLGAVGWVAINKPVKNQQPQVSPATEPATTSQSTSISVFSPNGDENWMIGSAQSIKWNSAGNISVITISLIPVNPDVGVRIIDKVANTDSYSWNIPYCYSGHECSSNFEIPAGEYKIQISGSGISDESDMPFNIIYSDKTADWKTYRNDEYGYGLTLE